MDKQKIEAMRVGGKILGKLLQDLKKYVQPGMSERAIDAWVRQEILKRGAGVAYDMLERKFPGAICISTNDELVHGVPTDYVLQEGDKVSFDLDIFYQGYFVDSAFTMLVGDKGSAAVRKMIKVTESAMWAGIKQVRAGAQLGGVGYAEKVLKAGKLGVIKNYLGHGIGREMMKSQMCQIMGSGDRICVASGGYDLHRTDVVSGKTGEYVDKDDGWTVKMKDGSIGCHCEHTVLVLEDGCEVLTLAD